MANMGMQFVIRVEFHRTMEALELNGLYKEDVGFVVVLIGVLIGFFIILVIKEFKIGISDVTIL